MHPELLIQAEAEEDAAERMVRVVVWYLSGWHYRTAGVKKPANPVIGETFAAAIPLPDGTRCWYVAEQVSHRPPVSALHIECSARGIVADGAIHTRSCFTAPQTASSVLEGTAVLRFGRRRERYRLSFPSVHAHGLLVGPLAMELGGRTRVVCDESGCAAEVEFKQVSLMRGERDRNVVTAEVQRAGTTVATVSGRWDGALAVSRPGTPGAGEVVFDAETAPVAPKLVLPVTEQGAGESRRRWAGVFGGLRSRPVVDWDSVARAKDAVEAWQRRLPVHRGEGAWTPRLFVRTTVRGAVSGREEASWELDRRGLPDGVEAPVLEWSRDCHAEEDAGEWAAATTGGKGAAAAAVA